MWCMQPQNSSKWVYWTKMEKIAFISWTCTGGLKQSTLFTPKSFTIKQMVHQNHWLKQMFYVEREREVSFITQ